MSLQSCGGSDLSWSEWCCASGQKFVLSRTSVQGALSLVLEVPVGLMQACSLVLVQSLNSPCVKGMEEDVVAACG